MPPFNFGEINIAVDGETSHARPEPDAPFHVLLLGNFSGRRGGKQSTAAKPILVDRDNFDEVLAGLQPELRLDLGNEDQVTLQFTELDDFHPDRLFERVKMFRKLREMRARLQDPDTFGEAAEELGLRQGTDKQRQARQETTSASPLVLGNLLDDMIEQTEARVQKRAPAEDDLQKFVRQVTEPHLVASADPQQAEILALVDRALGNQMRALLHVPEFQTLEAAWRAVFLLVRRVETDELLKIYLLDLSKDELADHLNSSPDLRSTWSYRMLAGDAAGSSRADPWAVVVGNYTFGATRDDAELLGRLAKIAHAAEAPFLASAESSLLGCESFSTTPNPSDWILRAGSEDASAWSALRGLPEANAVGLALPRFLLRLPYGKETDPIESFVFEEMPKEPEHEDYLWGNPAFVCALLLAQSFSESGWDLRAGQRSELDGLPVHVYKRDGDSDVRPCAETLMPIHTAERIMESGLMPLASMKGQDAVRVVRFQSIAQPVRALAGRWSR
ncbi:MAG TPA: type VI secretion system contractile sheath large subunit [Candidatus Sulfotelmatobacter sp.]